MQRGWAINRRPGGLDSAAVVDPTSRRSQQLQQPTGPPPPGGANAPSRSYLFCSLRSSLSLELNALLPAGAEGGTTKRPVAIMVPNIRASGPCQEQLSLWFKLGPMHPHACLLVWQVIGRALDSSDMFLLRTGPSIKADIILSCPPCPSWAFLLVPLPFCSLERMVQTVHG